MAVTPRSQAIAVARRLRGVTAIEVVAQGPRVRTREQGVGIQASAVNHEVVQQMPSAKLLIPVYAEKVELGAAAVGEIGTLETAGRIRQGYILDVMAAEGAGERTEVRKGRVRAAVGTLNERDRHDELVLVVDHAAPEHQRAVLQ